MSSRSVRARPGADAASVRRPVLALAAALVLVLSLAGCAAPTPPRGLTELLAQPGERALLDGMRAYDDGQYAAAETALRQALAKGLASPHDRASAHKLLAFIQCTSDRVAGCEADFVAARQADAGFVLNRAEAGHPLWGPVYRRVLQ